MAAITYITDAEVFSTVNASTDTLIATALPQGAIDFYNPTMSTGTWYRYFNVSNGVTEGGNNLLATTNATDTHNGILQKLSGLTVGNIYNIEVDTIMVVNEVNLLIYSGTVLQSTHKLTVGTQTISYQAISTEDTIVIDTEYIRSPTLLTLNTIRITEEETSRVPHLSGFNVKPLSVSGIGTVTFTDGINSIQPNQMQCQAYGYTYNTVTGTCSAFNYNTNLINSVINENNRTLGAGNLTQPGTNNTLIMGESNIIRGFSRNSIVTGISNEISTGVNNASVSGVLGEATANNSKVLGGNASTDSLGERQTITLMYGGATTDSSTVNSFLNNTTDSYFVIPTDTIVMFETQTVAVRTGGTGGGAVGDYKAFSEVGVAINKSGVLSIDSTRTTISSSGSVSGWTPTVGVSGTNFLQQVKGANNRDIMWATTIRFTQIKTGVTL
mgnify:CR=1 FL=1